MPTFAFEGNDFGPPASIDVEEGGLLADICDEAAAPVLFSCRSASCGTCRVDVLEGADLFEPPKRDEIEVLETFMSPLDASNVMDRRPMRRLACQAMVRPGSGHVRIRWVGD